MNILIYSDIYSEFKIFRTFFENSRQPEPGPKESKLNSNPKHLNRTLSAMNKN